MWAGYEMVMFKWLWVKLGQAKHDYQLMGNADRHRCIKCGDIIYIPVGSEFWYQTKQFKGCTKF